MPDDPASAEADTLPTDDDARPRLATWSPTPRARRIISAVVALAVLGALAYFVRTNWDELRRGPWDVHWGFFAVALVLYVVSEGLPPLAWRSLMHSVGTDAPLPGTYFVWFAVEPLRYLPIPVGPVLGRFALADRVGLPPVPAVVTLAYEFVLSMALPITVAFPALCWLGFVVDDRYRWAVLVVAGFTALGLYLTLRPGGLGRLIADSLGEAGPDAAGISVPRAALKVPSAVTMGAFLVRICAAGTLVASLTPTPVVRIPLLGVVFAAGAAVPLGRFGTREAAIIVGLRALGVATGPATLAAISSRAIGLAASVLWLGIAAAAGGGRRVAVKGEASPPARAPRDDPGRP